MIPMQVGCAVFNPAQTETYIRAGLTRPGYWPSLSCFPDLAAIDPDLLADVWTTPENDGAWWTSPNRPESYGLAGYRITGIEVERQMERAYTVLPGCRPFARPGVRRELGQLVTITAEIHGATCCAVEYGLALLPRVLECCDDPCAGGVMRYPVCTPTTGAAASCATGVTLPSETGGVGNPGPWRCLFGAVMVSPPQVVGSSGPTCTACACGPITTVEWQMRAAPGRHTDLTTILAEQPLMQGAAAVCGIAPCVTTCTTTNALVDPTCTTTLPTRAPVTASSCLCRRMFGTRACFTLDASNLGWFEALATITVKAGTTDLRNVSVRLWPEVPGRPYEDYQDCNACQGFGISYLPAGARLTIDGRSGRTTARVAGSRDEIDASNVVYAADGLPYSGCVKLTCGRWVVCIDGGDDVTAATIQIQTSQVEP